MHGKVLIIDPVATHRIVLRVKLAASQYEVLQAESIEEATAVLGSTTPDTILCALNLPDGAPTRLLGRLRKLGLFGKVPIIGIGAISGPAERVELLSAGFDDVFTRPLDTTFLMARVRSLLRSHASASEWQLREGTSRALGFAEPDAKFGPVARVAVIARHPEALLDWQDSVGRPAGARLCFGSSVDVIDREEGGVAPDAFLLVTRPDQEAETLDLLASLRSHSGTRHCVVLVAQQDGPLRLGAQMLDMGANDMAPWCAHSDELAIRLKVLLHRKRMTDALRATVRHGIEAAVIDPLTGLHNRRYAMPHVLRIAERAQLNGKPFALMIADMDHFKRINDLYGHAAGDAVLIEVADRLRNNLRAVDLVARIGGEEFLMVLPGAGLANARKAAQRLCRKIGDRPITVPGHSKGVSATISIGMVVWDYQSAASHDVPLTAEGLLDRADQALYAAKADGRNRVTLARTAA